MRLERIEINGFKSFSDRSELAFDKGVTAIVGPNGCGKSNVADAITWVMGEQSAKSLRGEKMEDVIFSGSDARKPTAAAEVRLRFSGVLKTVTGPAFDEPRAEGGASPVAVGHGHGHGNGNGSDSGPEPALSTATEPSGLATADQLIRSVAREVEVTRRLFRSGESEYLIDDQICRLRDVHELLMDTGLGAKAYAIIEQGKIGLILSSRPIDRRQLIEEAAGVTKYKARRRSAELKLDAAQQNLTRIDDIVYELEKQRGTLKRQAAKARRYQRLRDELRRWEKVLFARKYRQLAETIEVTRGRLGQAQEREVAASAHLGELESNLSRLRLGIVEAESRAMTLREEAHGRELDINRLQQQTTFDAEQIERLVGRAAAIAGELESLEARRGPAGDDLVARQAGAAAADVERDQAAATYGSELDRYDEAHREIEGLEADVEAARSEVFSAINAATALRHSLEHAAAARVRAAETLSKLDVESGDVRRQAERVQADHRTATEAIRQVQDAIEATRLARNASESELARARTEYDSRARLLRTREHELAGLQARLQSLEELQADRAQFGDAARTVLAQANGTVGQRGALADYLEVEPGYERVVEVCLGDLLQYVLVERPEHAAAGMALLRDECSGRCGFLVIAPEGVDARPPVPMAPDTRLLRDEGGATQGPEGMVALSSVYRVIGPFSNAIRAAIGDAWIAQSYAQASVACLASRVPIVTLAGEVFDGPHLVTGGMPGESRGILETKRALKELRERIQHEQESVARLAEETARFQSEITEASRTIADLAAEHHRQEKAMVAQEAQSQRAADESTRFAQRSEQLERERRQAEEERDRLEQRQLEARESIARLEDEQRSADERLTEAQRRLFEARETAQHLSRRAAEAGATHAALVERVSGLQSEIERLREVSADLEARAVSLAAELQVTRDRDEELKQNTARNTAQLDEHVQRLDVLRAEAQTADDAVSALRDRSESLEAAVKAARTSLESQRAEVADLNIARATAEGDLGHLAQASLDTVQATLDEVAAEVADLEARGEATPDNVVIRVDDAEDTADDDDRESAEPVTLAERRSLSAEEAIGELRSRIDRLGPVNMMAIDQFDELEERHVFLNTQRTDLVDSIAQTSEAIKRIDETTKQRFTEAFSEINTNFQQTFSTLFGGGRAGLALLDESDPLESGIEIIAQPPGKRLQNVQLLSGGEKALTAIALMFGLFKYKPSPFCLLDEIDAPLDDANIGRFVEMLRGMQHHTQFILITHNRKTMEIADRLYGVTMEEPGVSKLISVQLH